MIVERDRNTLRMSNWMDESVLEMECLHPDFYAKRVGDKVEFDIYLSKRPNTNVFKYKVRGTGLSFYYQPPLTDKDIAAGAYRPDDVVGSYAVYHPSKRDNKYRTGKFCHIYRPLLIDSGGNKSWAKLRHRHGTLSVVADPVFLKKAAYPVIVDPTIGYTSDGGSERTASAGYLWCGIRGQADATGGVASKLSAFMRMFGAGSATLKQGFYEDNSGTPVLQDRVAADNTGVTINSTSDAWYDSNAISGAVAASTYYWPCLLISATDGTPKYNYDSAGSNVSFYKGTGYTDLPDPWAASGSASSDQISIYVTYESESTGATNVVYNII